MAEITAEQLDALAESYQSTAGQGLEERERAVLIALSQSKRMRQIQMWRIERMLEGTPQEAQDACLWVEAFELGRRFAEGQQLDSIFNLEAEPS